MRRVDETSPVTSPLPSAAAAMAACSLSLTAPTIAKTLAAAPCDAGSHNAGMRSSVNCGAFSQSEFFASKPASVTGKRQLSSVTSRRNFTVCKISKGDTLPPVGLRDQDGRLVNLSKYKGKPLVLYFYPADETPGCTKQACAFRDSYEKFKKAGAEVVGVSGDPPESHKAFKAKYRLPFTLLSDEGNKLRKDWGVPSDFFGSLAGRQTYVMDKNGVVQLIFNNQFQPEKHIVETLKVLQS